MLKNEYTNPNNLTTSKVEFVLAKFNRNKSTWSDGIVIEMEAALDDFDIDKVTDIINEILNRDDILEDLNLFLKH